LKGAPKTKRSPGHGQGPSRERASAHSMINQVEAWAARNEARRSEAIRSLVEIGLAGTQPIGKRNPKAASKASELAGEQTDKLADSSATKEERHSRERRRLKGPGEFREIRGDIAKPKSRPP